MATYILRRKVFADVAAQIDKSEYNKFSDWLKSSKKMTPGDDGKFADWGKLITDKELIKEYQDAKNKLVQENKEIAEKSVINRAKKYAGEVWEKHKTPIKIGGGVVLASGAGYGGYKYYKNRQAKAKEAASNEEYRNRIVGKEK